MKNKKLILLLIFGTVILIAVLFFVFNSSYFKDYISGLTGRQVVEQTESSFKKGVSFLLETSNGFFSGAPIIIKNINKICQDDKLDKLWKDKMDGDVVGQDFLYRLYDPEYQYEKISDIDNISDTITRVIVKSSYCEKFTFENIEKDIEQITRDGGYNSNHILFSLQLIKDNQCYDPSLVDPMIEQLVNELSVSESKKIEGIDNFCNSYLWFDTYAERAAFIGYAGFPIDKIWIDNIKLCQLEDGSWVGDTHASSLALWAIAQYQGNCE